MTKEFSTNTRTWTNCAQKEVRKNSYVNAWREYVSFDNDVKIIGKLKNMPKNIVGFGPQ
jgi:hypothetical protein